MARLRLYLIVCMAGIAARMAVAVPYSEDSYTLHLYHFDGDATDSVAANPIHLTLDSGATATDAKVPGLGQALYTYEGTAATGATLPSAMAATTTAISNFVGEDGAFTFEALVCPAFGLGAIPNNMQIVSGEHDASRGWHFRVESAGNLVFTKLTGTVQDNMRMALPSSGPHAFEANKWFHAAVTYSGQADTDGNLKLYWTALDSGATEAVELASFRMAADLDPVAAPIFVVGNEARNFNGRTENWEGWIDEVRISGIARSPADMAPFVNVGGAHGPKPANGAVDVPREVTLGWTSGESSVTSDVYFGLSADDVANATLTDPLGVLVSQGQTGNTCYAGRLEFGKTYYWRVDGISAAPAFEVVKGSVWNFTVELYSSPITGVTATASSSHNANMGPERTIDGSGLNADDQHSTVAEDGWLSDKNAPQPAWIQYAFDKLYKLDRMIVWNSNQAMEFLFGFGAKNVTVEYSADGSTWTTLGEFEFARATSAATYTANTSVDFAGAAAKYVKLTIAGNWGGVFKQFGLSEVRFFSIPVAAREPAPADGATDVAPQVTLSWRAGREAGSHRLYLDTDRQSVIDAVTGATTVAEPRYETAVDLARTYYWKVVEVNQAETPGEWESPVWSFATSDFLVVDDFESYTNNSPNRVFQTWADGAGFSPDEFFPNGNPGNATGSLVGYDPQTGNIMETRIVYGGAQAMPLFYDNGASPKISEVQRTFATPQDWSKHGITTLVLLFYGDPANGAAPVYIKLNDTKLVYKNGAAATTKAMWQRWNIDLASVAGLDLKSIQTLVIGVGDGSAGGTGLLLIDEIRLYRVAPPVVVPTDAGAAGLAALYSMEGDVQDGSGAGLHGTANGEPAYVTGLAGTGQAMTFDGTNDYVDLPIGPLVSTLNSATLAGWVDFFNAAGAWQRVFDFGTGTANYMFLTPRSGTTGPVRFTILTPAVTAEQAVQSRATLPSGWHHVAVVIDSAVETQNFASLRLYQDGTLVGTGATAVVPKDLGSTTQNWLGRSQWTADAYYTGSLDELRIYNRALSEAEIRYLAGDR